MISGAAAFFRRFRFADGDLAEVEREIAEDQAAVAEAAGASPVVAAALIRLGFNITPLGKEAEAAAYLEAGPDLARQLGEPGQEISALLHLATARQYLGERWARTAAIQAVLRAPQLQPAPLVAAAMGASVASVVAEMTRQISVLEQQLTADFEQHPDAEVVLSLPGPCGSRSRGDRVLPAA